MSVDTSIFKEVILPVPPLQEGLSAAWVPRDPLPDCGESCGRDPRDMNHTKGGLVIFTANSHPSSRELGKRIAEWVHDEDSNDIKDTHTHTRLRNMFFTFLSWMKRRGYWNCNRDLLRKNTFHFAFLQAKFGCVVCPFGFLVLHVSSE